MITQYTVNLCSFILQVIGICTKQPIFAGKSVCPKKRIHLKIPWVYDPFPFWPNSNLEHVETTAKNMWLLRCDRFLRLGLKVKPVSSASTGAH